MYKWIPTYLVVNFLALVLVASALLPMGVFLVTAIVPPVGYLVYQKFLAPKDEKAEADSAPLTPEQQELALPTALQTPGGHLVTLTRKEMEEQQFYLLAQQLGHRVVYPLAELTRKVPKFADPANQPLLIKFLQAYYRQNRWTGEIINDNGQDYFVLNPTPQPAPTPAAPDATA